jgi:hypothetical protein
VLSPTPGNELLATANKFLSRPEKLECPFEELSGNTHYLSEKQTKAFYVKIAFFAQEYIVPLFKPYDI